MTPITEPVSGATKAAMFLMGIGDQVSAELLRQLDADEIRQVTSQISVLEAVAPHHMMSVFREFESLTGPSRFFAKGGAGFARRLIEQALGTESTQKLLDAAEPSAAAKPNAPDPGLQLLQNTDPRQLAAFLRKENPQTIALVLSNMTPEAGGALLQLLPAELQAQAALRMATLDRISPEVLRKIAEAIGCKLKAIRKVTRSDGIRSLAALLNHVEPALAEKLLSQVDQENQAAANSVRNLMFTFEDILRIDKEGMRTLLAQLDRKILTLALKGAAGKVREHFTKCMSQRAAEMLTEDMDALGPVRIRDVQGAQQQVVGVVRQLQQQGTIATSRGGTDEYVV
ncbi:MAG: flagellar motor switch protein FliG [Candidatus Solibacter sp.]|jgi:flagellar motor switch protein FliG